MMMMTTYYYEIDDADDAVTNYVRQMDLLLEILVLLHSACVIVCKLRL